MDNRICSKCGVEFPLTNEYFAFKNKAQNSLRHECKSCFKEMQKKSVENRLNRGKVLKTYVSEDEANVISNNAAEMNMDISRYLRYTAIKNAPIIIKDIANFQKAEEKIGKLEYALLKVGVNINQISHNLNSHGVITQNSINSLINFLEKVNTNMEEIKELVAESYEVLYK